MSDIWSFVERYSLLLVFGAIAALVWANIDAHSYHAIVDYVLVDNSWIGAGGEPGAGRTLTLHYLVNDVLMAFFFAVAGKEVWEAIILNDGSLRGSKAATPLIATIGGMIGPVAVYLGLALALGSDTYQAVAHGWAVPTATDIAFSYLVGRIVFGAGHPAIRFLMLLAIADDALGLLILAVFYPTAAIVPGWLLAALAVAFAAFFLFNWLPLRLDGADQAKPWSSWVRSRFSFWPYALAGAFSWYAFQESGIHPALGLLPIIPAIPHADRGFGIFAAEEAALKDLLNVIEHALTVPVQIILLFFGFANAGVEMSSAGYATWLVLAGLMLGKPVGIFLFAWVAMQAFRLQLPTGMRIGEVFVLGCVAGIGFTVALFVASVAFHPGMVQDGAKMGALLSLASAVTAIIFGRVFKVIRVV